MFKSSRVTLCSTETTKRFGERLIYASVYIHVICVSCYSHKNVIFSYIAATSGKDGRKALMREIELGKLLGVKPQGNVVTFIGCVTTQSKT